MFLDQRCYIAWLVKENSKINIGNVNKFDMPLSHVLSCTSIKVSLCTILNIFILGLCSFCFSLFYVRYLNDNCILIDKTITIRIMKESPSWSYCWFVEDEVRREKCEYACDFVTHAFCHPCSLCQEGREIRRRMPHPGFNAQPFLVMIPPVEQAMGRGVWELPVSAWKSFTIYI